jgi:hypothetical protein
MSTIAPNATFTPEEVTTYINAFAKRVNDNYLSGSFIASKVKYIQNETGTSLVTIFVDGAKELYNIVNTPDMSQYDKDIMVQKLSMMFNVHILDTLAALKALSPNIAAFGWKIDKVFPLIRNMFAYGGMNHKTNTPIYGVGDFRFVLYMSPHLSVDDGVDGLRVTPLCNNSIRENTPMIVNVAEESAKIAKLAERPRRNRNNVDEDNAPTFVTPSEKTIEELATPNIAFAKEIGKEIVDHVIGNGAFASRALKWMEEKTLVGDETKPRCLTRIKIDYSKSVDMRVRRELPSVFFQITTDAKTDVTRFPSAYAQSVVLRIACEESLRFLANWTQIIENVSIFMEKDAPTIGWRATSVIPLVYDKERFLGKHVEKGGSTSMIIVPLTSNLVGAWKGKHPLCNNTAAEGFPMIVDTGRAPSGPYVNAARTNVTHTSSSLSLSGSAAASGATAPRRTTVGATGRR